MSGRLKVIAVAIIATLSLPASVFAANAPKPVNLSGSGARVLTVNVARNQPVVVTASHTGSSNFVVELVGAGTSELLVNEIGRYRGQVAWADGKSGRYRIKVAADGRWTIRVTQPVPSSGNTRIPRTIAGNGSRVVAIRATHEMQPIIAAVNRGRDNFVVHIIGYGSTQGQELLFNEIGSYRGETLMEELPAGPYLVAVEATDGAWSIKFSE